MSPIPRTLRALLVLAFSALLAGCAGLSSNNGPSFIDLARTPGSANTTPSGGKGVSNMTGEDALHSELHVSDQLAIHYADNVARILRGRFTGARIIREVSSTAQVGMGVTAGAAGPLHLGNHALALLGIGSAVVPELQRIFNAKGRAENYQEAVRMIEEGIVEYLSFNQKPSNSELTQNGVSLIHRTNAAIHIVEQSLAGLLPTLEQMKQATERMSVAGATRTDAGRSTPKNNITASGIEPELPKREEIASVPETHRQPPVEIGTEVIRGLRREIAANLAKLNRPGAAIAIVTANSLTPNPATDSAEVTVCKAILAKAATQTPPVTGVNPSISGINTYQRNASLEQLTSLEAAMTEFIK